MMGSPIRDKVAEGREKVGLAGRPAARRARKAKEEQGRDHVFSVTMTSILEESSAGLTSRLHPSQLVLDRHGRTGCSGDAPADSLAYLGGGSLRSLSLSPYLESFGLSTFLFLFG